MKRKTAKVFHWENREEDLKKVERYNRFKTMFYRTDLSLHSARVQQMVQRLLPAALLQYPGLDAQKTVLISKFHDDYEMASERGDVQLHLKYNMNGHETERLKQEEIKAARLLSRHYGNPKIQGHRYLKLLMHSINKDCAEAQLHSFADKLDGYCEALHEVLAGNVIFLEAVINYVAKTFNDLPGRFPLIREVFRSGNGLFHFPVIDMLGYFPNGTTVGAPHTAESVAWKATTMPHYEMWKDVTLSLPDGLEHLTRRKEPKAPL